MSTEIQRQQNFTLNFFDKDQVESIQRGAKMLAKSDLVPDIYKESDKNPLEKAMANCIIALEMSQRVGASPLMVMQNMIVIYGKPSWSSTFLIATINTCGRFEPLKYKFVNKGKLGKVDYTDYEWQNNRKVAVTKQFDGSKIDNLECIAYTNERGSEEILESSPISIELAIKEGWYTKAGSKWTTMERQMLMYRSAAFWSRSYAPEISMGMQTADEIQDSNIIDIDAEIVETKVENEIKQEANKTVFEVTTEEVIPAPEKTKDKIQPATAEMAFDKPEEGKPAF